MHALIAFNFVVLLFVLVRSADIAITSALARSVIRAICYGIVALLALVAVVLVLF